MSEMKIQRSVALAVFEFCGWKSAANWDNARMAKKLSDVKDVLPEKGIPDELKEPIASILTTTEENGTFLVEADPDGGKEEAPTKKEKAADTSSADASTGETKVSDKAAAKAEKAAEREAAKTAAAEAKAAAKAAKAAEREAKATAAKAEKVAKAPKVAKEPKEKDPKSNRMYCAAFVLREFGSIIEPDNAKSNELAAKVDEMTGRANTRESLNYLKNARKCIAGWLAGTPPAE